MEFLLVGGYAVGYHGYPRTTADMDIWVGMSTDNARKLMDVFQRFGMNDPGLSPELFCTPGNIVRMGLPPVRIEVLTSIDGVEFDACYKAKVAAVIDGLPIPLISKPDLLRNKIASGRHKDLDDVEQLGASD